MRPYDPVSVMRETRVERIGTDDGGISLAYDGEDDAAAMVVLAHGAGAGREGDFLTAVATGLARHGAFVCRFNFPYAERGRKAPDRQPVLEATWQRVLDHIPGDGRRLVVGGKSLGGRVASHLVASGAPCDGLLFLGYPLHPPGKPDRLRVAHLAAISAPMLFVAGTRDPLCPSATLEEAVRRLQGRIDIVFIEGGDHSFRVRRGSGRTTEQAWDEVTSASWSWISAL
jgi:predicted alpha/beta-hydrolase family hydrolase